MISSVRWLRWAFGLGSLILEAGSGRAEVFTIDSAPEWQTWQFPQGLVQISQAGHLELTRFRRGIDPVRDAEQFTHPTVTRGQVSGGIWRAASNPQAAARIIDGDRRTSWKPEAADPLAAWEVEIDLGRAVLVRQLRLIFPDEEGAHPFRQFSVYVATGATITIADDLFSFDTVYQTTLPNTEREIAIDLSGRKDTTRVLDPGLDPEDESGFRVVQYIRFGADAKSEDAALAEIEVVAVGDNIGLGALERGGTFSAGLVTRDPQFMIDGNMNTHANKFTVFRVSGDWKADGLWWELDLGALFWLDEVFLYFNDPGEGASGSTTRNAGTGFAFRFSEGRRTTSGEVDYTPLVAEGDEQAPFYIEDRHFRYLFAPRQVRYLLWYGFVTPQEWHARVPELMLFSPGYPAQVVLRSGFIDLGRIAGDNRPKAIRSLSWEVELPPRTRMQLRSRSGSSFKEEYTFHDKKGEIVTEARWNSLPKAVKGPVDTVLVAGGDWSPWSNFYQLSGEAFQSENPRRFLQLEAILSTDDPEVAPVLRSLAIEYEDALVRQARGRLEPRQARPNEATRFTYTLWPSVGEDDSGFDALRLVAPEGLIDAGRIEVRSGEERIAPAEVSVSQDSLWVFLPQQHRADSLELSFTARLLRNATVFALDLGNAARPGLWQSVEAVERGANVVFLPELTGSQRLIRDLEIIPPAFTPNGDGINDQLEIRFAVLKVEKARPRVRIFDLAGRPVAELTEAGGGLAKVYRWSGIAADGHRVAPGVYLCHIDLGAEVGKEAVARSIAVVY
ncbi:MAG: gliding motility-associated C-terminal domain-containing protein [Candidatus Latescibacteria bacterium]|nr:gliding motility-associated C-terminal domain-containing protein [Candidatus Latescibacterota bacterium]